MNNPHDIEDFLRSDEALGHPWRQVIARHIDGLVSLWEEAPTWTDIFAMNEPQPSAKHSEEKSPPASVEMPRYKCHKLVHALKIISVSFLSEKEGDAAIHRLHFAEPGYAPLAVTPEFIDRHKPTNGSYYVVYEDGYASVSPGEAFEKGYRRMGENAERPTLRSAFWHELDLEGRIERMRAILKGVDRTATRTREELSELSSDFHHHEHNAAGKIVGPIRHAGRPMGLDCEAAVPGTGGEPKPVFF